LVIAELVVLSALAAADAVAEALLADDDELPRPCCKEFSAVLSSERSLLSELVIELAAPLAKPAAAPAAALFGSCSEVRKLSADEENWLDGGLGAVCAFAPAAPLLPVGKLCPVEKALADEFAALLCWLESSASRA